jgi:hypothetical protein
VLIIITAFFSILSVVLFIFSLQYKVLPINVAVSILTFLLIVILFGKIFYNLFYKNSFKFYNLFIILILLCALMTCLFFAIILKQYLYKFVANVLIFDLAYSDISVIFIFLLIFFPSFFQNYFYLNKIWDIIRISIYNYKNERTKKSNNTI